MALISRFIILVGLLLALGLVQTAMAAEATSSTAAGGEDEEASLTTTKAPASETSEPGSEATSDVESSSVGTSTGSKQEEQQDPSTLSFPSVETDIPDMNENAAPTSVRDPGFVALSLGFVIMCGGMMALV